jgi:homoserine kinase
MIKVRIPATSANLGPGFDCMGMALDLWNTFELHEAAPGQGIVVESHGEGAATLPTGPTNLVAQTMLAELNRLTDDGRRTTDHAPDPHPSSVVRHPSSFRIVCRNAIPCASGLGSSSTAVLAGLIFAHTLARGHMDRDVVLARATSLEGHGDNVGPALYGGLLLISYDGATVVAERVELAPLRVVVCVPEFNFLTSEARAALPKTVSRADAVFNAGRAMLVAEALRNGDDALLARAMADRLHEPYRIPLIPGAAQARRGALEHGAIAVSLSGAGPGMLAFARAGHEHIGQAMRSAFEDAGLAARFWVLDASPRGVEIMTSA